MYALIDSFVDYRRIARSKIHIHQSSLIVLVPTLCSFIIYRLSLSSLFILAIFAETERSMVRSPISTTSPPRISGLTLETTLTFLPWPTYCDLETADSMRERVRLSRG